jgi:hypothetical protein
LGGYGLNVVKSGGVRLDANLYPAVSVNGYQIKRAVVKKVGRPFDQYRGRASARR